MVDRASPTSFPSTGSASGPRYLSCGVGPNDLTSDDKSSKEKVEVYDSSATVREYIGCIDRRKSVSRRASSTRLASRFELEKHVLTCVTGRPGTRRPTASVKVQSRIERRGRVCACLSECVLMDKFSGTSPSKSEMCRSVSSRWVMRKDIRCTSHARSQ